MYLKIREMTKKEKTLLFRYILGVLDIMNVPYECGKEKLKNWVLGCEEDRRYIDDLFQMIFIYASITHNKHLQDIDLDFFVKLIRCKEFDSNNESTLCRILFGIDEEALDLEDKDDLLQSQRNVKEIKEIIESKKNIVLFPNGA